MSKFFLLVAPRPEFAFPGLVEVAFNNVYQAGEHTAYLFFQLVCCCMMNRKIGSSFHSGAKVIKLFAVT